jgi:RNA polymerase sigma-70 factor (ECF subfamily)
MKPRLRRSRGVSTAAVATATEPVDRVDEAKIAFEALYRQNRDDVYAYLAGLLRDRSAAEEVTAQAFERAWRRRRQLDPERGSSRAWLFGIARNAALDELRRRSRLGELPSSEPGPTPPAGPAYRPGGGDPAELAINRALVGEALRALAGPERELVALKFFAGLSNAEIAAVTGTTESNAGTRLHRVIKQLRRSLDEAD